MPVYFALDEENNRIKIGFTNKEPIDRIAEIAYQLGVTLKVLGQVPGKRKEELALHKQFHHLWIEAEWFRPEEELLNFIATTAQRAKTKRQLATERRQQRERFRTEGLQTLLLAKDYLPNETVIKKLVFLAEAHKMSYQEFLERLVDDYYKRFIKALEAKIQQEDQEKEE